MSELELLEARRAREHEPMRFAFADPPYPGQAARRYGDHVDYAGEVDYAALIATLETDYPDGWALCLGSRDLAQILPLCPAPVLSKKRAASYVQGTGVRIVAWVKPYAAIMPRVHLQFAWEPIVVRGGRSRRIEDGILPDWVKANPVRPCDADGLVGAKPHLVSTHVFRALGARHGDELADLFPGSGAVAAAWASHMAAPPLSYPGRDHAAAPGLWECPPPEPEASSGRCPQ